MTLNHRRHAATNRRRIHDDDLPANVNVLDARYSPTAVYGGMATDSPDVISLPGGVVITIGGLPDATTAAGTTSSTPVLPTTTSTSTVIVIPSTSSTAEVVTSTTPSVTPVAVTTSSTTPVVAAPATTSTTPLAGATTTPKPSDPVQTSTFFQTSTRAASITSSAAPTNTSSADTDDSSSVSTGAVVGGIGAGVVAVAALGFAIAFFLRRSRRSRDANAFDANDFRRSAMVINDPPTHEDTIARGYNPRPPSMVEHRFNTTSPAPTFGTKYGAPAPDEFNYGNGNEYQAGYPSFAPGQVMNATTPGYGPNSADPLFPPAAYAQSPFSPAASPVSATMYNEYGEPVAAPVLTRQPSHGAPLGRQDSYNYNNGQDSYNYNHGHDSYEYGNAPLNRQPSYGIPQRQMSNGSGSAGAGAGAGAAAGISAAAMSFYPNAVRQTYENQPMPNPSQSPPPPPPPSAPIPPTPMTPDTTVTDYVDLTRSSVSPFQAAQYAEISRRLDTEPPRGLDAPSVAEIIRNTDGALPPVPPKETVSPFADPVREREETMPASRISSDSTSQELDFPVPPSPAATYNSRYRVDSTPPMLPEIHVESRVSVSAYAGAGTFPGAAGESPVGSGFPSGVSGRGLIVDSRFPSTPSPLASSFGIPSPDVDGSFEAAGAMPSSKLSNIVAEAPAHAIEAPKRPETVYDPEDAYGGI